MKNIREKTNLKKEILNDQEAYADAKKRVEAKMGFYIHLAVYLIVITLLIIINLTFSKDYFWAVWPMLGWGSGLIVHGPLPGASVKAAPVRRFTFAFHIFTILLIFN